MPVVPEEVEEDHHRSQYNSHNGNEGDNYLGSGGFQRHESSPFFDKTI
jgi:hypothetical protein